MGKIHESEVLAWILNNLILRRVSVQFSAPVISSLLIIKKLISKQPRWINTLFSREANQVDGYLKDTCSMFHISSLPTALQSQSHNSQYLLLISTFRKWRWTKWLDKQADKMVEKYKMSNTHLPHVSVQELAIMFMQIRKKRSKRKLCK